LSRNVVRLERAAVELQRESGFQKLGLAGQIPGNAMVSAFSNKPVFVKAGLKLHQLAGVKMHQLSTAFGTES
jgi:hypothetical protein